MRPEIRILIADDHPLLRQGLRQVIEADPQLKVVAEVGDGAAALAALEQAQVEVAVLDIDMPGMDGFEVAQALAAKRWKGSVIFLTMHKNERFFNAALDVGAKGYVLKDSAVTEIVNSIKTVVAGQSYISPQLSSFLLNRAARATQLTQEHPGVAQLTPAERRILKLIALYKTTKEIADELCLSTRTVDHHRANIAEKLNLKGYHALIKFAVKHQSEL
jgi:two-component system, NarL family, response regulator DegU